MTTVDYSARCTSHRDYNNGAPQAYLSLFFEISYSSGFQEHNQSLAEMMNISKSIKLRNAFRMPGDPLPFRSYPNLV